jgi:hypothetical protein
MDYPKEFSAQARARVEAEQLKASIKFEEAQRWLKPLPGGVIHGPGSCIHRFRAPEVFNERAFYLYVLRVFLAFSREACELGKQGIWTVGRIQSEAKHFLCRLTVAEYYEQLQDRFGGNPIWDLERNRPLVADATTGAGSLLPKVKRFIYESEEWRHCEAELLSIAEHQAQGAGPKEPAEGGFGTRKGSAPNVADHDGADSVQPMTVDGRNEKNPEPQFSNRAAWLKDRLLERGWSSSDPSKYRGPDRKTIEKILRGEAVRNDVLEKLADSLSRKHANVSVLDIPQD